MNGNKDRVVWIDVAKGITIILVIVGHTIDGIGRGAIFSFHLPLFFILSAITYRFSTGANELLINIEKALKHLVVPAYLMFLCSTVILFFRDRIFNDIDNTKGYFRNVILTATFTSGVEVNVNGAIIWCFGIPWFLIVLFIGRTLFDYWQMRYGIKRMVIYCAIASILGVICGELQWVPFSLDIVLAIIPFFLVGMYMKYMNIESKALIKAGLYGIAWGVLYILVYRWKFDYMELAQRRYTLYPLCHFTAILGTLFISEMSVLLSKLNVFSKSLGFIGRYSLYLLFIHHLDYFLLTQFYNIADNVYINALLRVIVDLSCFFVFIGASMWIKRYLKMRTNC